MRKDLSNQDNENKIKKVLFNEVTFFVAIISIVMSITFFIVKPDTQMDKDIALISQKIQIIEENHLMTIQKCLEKQEVKDKEQDEKLENIGKDIREILTILRGF